MNLRWYFSLLFQSFISTEPYVALLKRSLWTTIGVFVISMILIGLSTAWRSQNQTLPRLQKEAHLVVTQIRESFPQDFSITWDGLKLTTSNTEPLQVPYPNHIQVPNEFPKNLAYISSIELTQEQVKSMPTSSVFVVTPTQLLVNNLENQWRGTPLTSVLDDTRFTLDKNTIGGYLDGQDREIDTTSVELKNISWLVGPLWTILHKFVTTFFYALLLFIFLRSFHEKFNFKKSWQLSLHIVIVASVVSEASKWIQSGDFPVFFMSFWLIFAYVWLNKRSQLTQV